MIFDTRHARPGLKLLLTLCAGLSACTPGLSRDSLTQVTPHLPLAEVAGHPERFLGRTLVIVGSILQVDNTPEGTLVEVLAYPPLASNKPDLGEPAIGRFLLRQRGFLDPLIYAQGREVAAVARVAGQRDRTVGQAIHREPLMDVVEIHLLEQATGYRGLPVNIGLGFGFGF